VLLCVSDPAVARSLVTVAAALSSAESAPLEALYVIPADRDSAVLPGERSPQHRAPLAAAEDQAKALGVRLESTSFVSGDVSADIVSFAYARGASLVLVGMHRSVFLSGSLGGVVGEVLATSSVPVGVLVERGLTQVKRVLLLVSDDPASAAATRVAERFRASGCEVIAMPTGTLDAAYDPAVHDACKSVDLAVCALTGKTSLLTQGMFFPGMDDAAPVPCSILGVSARTAGG
jgi:nucleotide-binding universal stress UspA family protein